MKKIISFISVLAMLISMMTTVAFADENNRLEWEKVDSTETSITLKLVLTTNQTISSAGGSFVLDDAKTNGVTAVKGTKIEAATFNANFSRNVVAFKYTNTDGGTGRIEMGTLVVTFGENTKSFKLPIGEGSKYALTISTPGEGGAESSILDSFTTTADGQEIVVKEDVKDPTIALDPTSATLKMGKTETVTITATTENFDGTVEWKSDNEKVATVDKGVVTAVGAGEATITATAGTATATCKITVEPADVPAPVITVKPDTAEMILGNTVELTASNDKDVKLTYKYESSNTEVATVDDNGVVKAVGVGEATITVSAEGATPAECAINVRKAKVGDTDISDKKIKFLESKLVNIGNHNQLIYITKGDETRVSDKTIGEILGGEWVEGSTVEGTIAIGVISESPLDAFSFEIK